MGVNKIDAKTRIKRSTVTTTEPTIGPSGDHTDGTWSSTDIYSGELFYNEPDQRLWIGTETGIREFVLGSTAGSSASPFVYGTTTGITPKLGSNTASGGFSVVSGGEGNIASTNHSTVSGGNDNTANGGVAPTVGGGENNTASGNQHPTVSGGAINTASGNYSTVCGGLINTASTIYSSIAGGHHNSTSVYTNVHISGSNLTATSSNATFVENLISTGVVNSAGSMTSGSISTGAITATSISAFSATGIITADSGITQNGVNLKTKILDIGDWNMDTTNSINVAHGLTLANIRNITWIIRDDANTTYYSPHDNVLGYSANINTIGATNINLVTNLSSLFSTTAFDSTSYNRGWITITYVA